MENCMITRNYETKHDTYGDPPVHSFLATESKKPGRKQEFKQPEDQVKYLSDCIKKTWES